MTEMKTNDKFELDAMDAAIVIKQDMTAEMYLPNLGGENAEVDTEKNQNVYIVMAMLMSMDDPEFRALIQKKLDTIFATIDTLDDGPSCSPEGGCHGCDKEDENEDN